MTNSVTNQNHPSPIVEYEVAGTDDDNVASHNHASQSDVAVFMDDGCDNVRTARTSVAVEHYAQTRTAHGCAYEASHEILSRSQYLRRHSVRSVHQQLENHRKKVSPKMANVVLILNLGPKILMANVIRTALMMKYDHWIGNPVA